MEEGNVTNNLRELFLDTKGGCKIDCELSPTTFLCYNGANTAAYSYASQPSTLELFGN